MKRLIAFIVVLMPLVARAEEKKHELVMSMDDRFTVAETAKWSVEIEKELALRFANVKILPKKDRTFSLMLYFKCDTPDLAQFDSPAKIERAVRASSEKYLPGAVEKRIELRKLKPGGWYGCYTVITDAELAGKKEVSPGEFKYLTRGMIRLSKDSALAFSLMSNDLDGQEYKEVFKYILSFVKAKK
jgi:hypothetical protein